MPHDDRLLSLYKPILTIINLSGIHFPLKNPQRYITTSAIIIIAFILVTFKAQETISTAHFLPKHIRIEQYYRLQLYSSICIVLHIFVFHYRKSAHILAILDKLRCFDETLASKSVFCNREMLGFVAIFAATILFYLARIYVFYSTYEQLQLHTVTYTFVYYLQYSMILHYIFFLLHLLCRFRFLNSQLVGVRETNPVLTKRWLHLVKILHEHLLGVAREVDGVFGGYLAHAIVFNCLEQVMDEFFMFLLLREGNIGWGFGDLLVDWMCRLCFHWFFVFGFANQVETEVRVEQLLLFFRLQCVNKLP